MSGDEEVEVVPAATVKRGPNFTCAEDYELTRAWVATSEDAVVGAKSENTTAAPSRFGQTRAAGLSGPFNGECLHPLHNRS